MKQLLPLLVLLILAGCSDPDRAVKTLAGAGYHDIRVTGWRFGMCSKDDHYSTGFEAIGPTGVKVSGAVCSGLFFKGATIRLD